MNHSIAYFKAHGVEFSYLPSSPGVPQVAGPVDDAVLRTQFTAAVDARRGLQRRVKWHEGDCNTLGTKISGPFCTLCRHVSVCLFCGDADVGRGNLDCALCRLATVRGMREKGYQL